MSYFQDFPNTNFYNQDLGWLIRKYKELNGNVKILQQIYDMIKEQIKDITIEQLQEWLDDGTINNIIASLGKVVQFIDTTVEMLELDTLVEGNLIVTLGYYNVNDGGGAFFRIDSVKSKTSYQLQIGELYATLICSRFNVLQCGLKNDGITDNSELINKLLTYKRNIYFPRGTYLINNFNKLPDKIELYGEGVDISILKTESNDLIKIDLTSSNVSIHDLQLKGNGTQKGIYLINEGELITQDLQHHFYNMNISNFQYGIYIENNHRSCVLDTIRVESCTSDGVTCESTDCYFNLIDCALNSGYGFLIKGWDNTLSNCKAFCSGSKENNKSGIYINGGSYIRMINCISQQNTNSNLELNNVTASYIQCTCDSAGWTREDSDVVYNVKMNGCTKNHIFLEIIDGKFSGYCNNGVYSQYNNNNFNYMNFTFRNNYDIYNLFAGAFTTDNLYLFSNEIIVNGMEWYKPYSITSTSFIAEKYEISNGTVTEKKLTSNKNLMYKKLIPNNCTFILFLTEICTTNFAGEVVITYTDSTKKTISTTYWNNKSNLKGMTINIRDNLTASKTVSKIEMQIHTSETGFIENPKIMMRLGY